jgi:hypothetical protein
MTTDGWVRVDGNEAAARVAHRLSEVVELQSEAGVRARLGGPAAR